MVKIGPRMTAKIPNTTRPSTPKALVDDFISLDPYDRIGPFGIGSHRLERGYLIGPLLRVC